MPTINANPVVSSLGKTFVDQVATAKTHTPDEVKAQFAAFSSALDASLRPALAAFVKNELAANDDTRWMAELLAPTTSSTKATGDVRAATHDTLVAIKDNNARLHDKNAKSGIWVAFSDGEKPVALADVAAQIESGGKLQMDVLKYEKLGTGWAVAAALLGGSYPVLDDVGLKKVEHKLQARPIESAADLAKGWDDAQLT
jgi:hypothetical protein